MTSPLYDGYGDGWITDPADPRLAVLWPGAEDFYLDPVDGSEAPGAWLLGFPLYNARIQCEEFAPALADGAPVPENYVAAQVLQARALVRAGIVGDGDHNGIAGEGVVVFPMDWTVKNLLRPARGRLHFGRKRTS